MTRRLSWESARRRDRVAAFHESKARRVTARGLLPPTDGQLNYLSVLAESTGHSVVPPQTRRAAGLEIDRLKQLAAAKQHYQGA